jgi:hypothetical protein
MVLARSSLAAAGPPARIPAPARLVAKPLEPGQWVSYRESVGGRAVGTVSLVAVNRAECGMQFLAELSGSRTKRWMFCVDDDHRLVKAALDGKLVVLSEHLDELGALLTRVLPPQFAGTFTREDVTVPAGTFEGTERKDGTTTTWLHPDVPLGAVVQVKQGDREDTLVAYGVGAPPHEPARQPKRRWHRTMMFYEFGLSSGYRSHTPRSDHLEGFSFSVGFRGTAHVEPVASISARDNRSEVASDGDQTATLTALVGARWYPFGRRATSLPAGLPYVEAGAGYAHIGRNDLPTGDGFAAGVRIGWEVAQGADWGFAFQGEYVVDHTFGDASGTHQLVDAQAAIRLQLP